MIKLPLNIILLFVLFACFNFCSNVHSRVSSSKIIRVTNCKPPLTINIKDTLSVILKEYPGTGYMWLLDTGKLTKPGLHFIGKRNISKNESDENNSRFVEFDFSFSAKEYYFFRFLYKRPLDEKKAAEDSCFFRIAAE